MIRRLVPWLLVASAVVFALVVATRPSSSDRSLEARVQAVTSQLRCPVCQGLSVADSPSSTARSMADDVRRRLATGQSADEIKAAYVQHYGDWILLRPAATGVASLVWALPALALAIAIGGLALAFRRWRREPAMYASEADRDLVTRALGERHRLDPGT